MAKNKSAVWSFFASVHLAIVLLALLAFFALIGTVVPQREAAWALSERLSPELYGFLERMQIFDLYHSIWFVLLALLLSINLLVCSLDRFGAAWRRFRAVPQPARDDVFSDISEEQTIYTDAGLEKSADVAASLLQRKYQGLKREDADGRVYLCAGRGRYSHFGVYIVHVSILILIAAAVIGSMFGIQGYVNIQEGETISAISLRKGEKTLTLPFSVRCDKFTVEFYDNGMPKIFQSDLTFLRKDQVLSSAKLRVNSPIKFEGFRFYQASYGEAQAGRATLALMKDDGSREVMNVAQGYDFDLPGGEGTFSVLRVESNLMKMGPALKVSVRAPKQAEAVFWVFQDVDRIRQISPDIFEQVPVFNPKLFRPYTFLLLGLEEKYYTGLQVNRDPATSWVAFAAVLMIGGLMLILFSYARTVWIRLDRTGDQVVISIAGRSYKNASGLQNELKYLHAELSHMLEKSK